MFWADIVDVREGKRGNWFIIWPRVWLNIFSPFANQAGLGISEERQSATSRQMAGRVRTTLK